MSDERNGASGPQYISPETMKEMQAAFRAKITAVARELIAEHESKYHTGRKLDTSPPQEPS